MSEENFELVINLFDTLSNQSDIIRAKFKGKLHSSRQLSALIFMYSKLKEPTPFFLQAEHDSLYLGSIYEYQDFTQSDVETCIMLGVSLEDETFRIYASA